MSTEPEQTADPPATAAQRSGRLRAARGRAAAGDGARARRRGAHRAAAHAAAAPKKGGTLDVRPQRRADAARSGELDHRGRRLHARQDLRAAVRHEPGRAARSRGSRESHTTSADGLTWTFNLRPGVKFSDGTPLTAGGRRVLDQARGREQERPAQLPRLRDQDDQGQGHQQGRLHAHAHRGRRSSPTSRCSPTRSCRRTSAASPRRRSSPSRSAPGRSCSTRSRPSSNLTLKRNPHYWQAGQAVRRQRPDQLRQRRQPARAAGPGRPGRTSSTRCRRRTSPR